MQPKHIRLLLTLLVIPLITLSTLVFSGVATAQDDSTKIDVMQATGLPPQAAQMIIPQIVKQMGKDVTFKFQLLDNEKTPLKETSVILSWDDGKKELKTDAEGNILVDISPENMDGLSFEVPKGTVCKLVDSPIRLGGPGGGRPPAGAKMIPMGGGPAGSSFKPGDAEGAERIGGMLPELGDLFNTDLVGQPAPEIKIEDLAGAPEDAKADLASLRGKVVVLDFWATWCKPCIFGFKHLNDLEEELGDDFVIISITDEDRETAAETLKKHPLETWIGFDTDGSSFEDYKIKARPTAVVIGKDGKVVAVTGPQFITASALKKVADGKPWKPVAGNGGFKMTPKDISPDDISKDYFLTADQLAPPELAEKLGEMLEQMAEMTGSKMSGLGMKLRFDDATGKPAKRMTIVVADGESKTEVKTNYLGELTIELTEKNVDSLKVYVPANYRVIKPMGDAIGGSMSGSSMGGELIELDSSKFESMTDASDSFEVLHSVEHGDAAKKYINVLADIKAETEKLTGMKLDKDYGVVLHDFDEGSSISFKGGPRFPFRADVDLDSDVKINWVINHEWVEGTLLKKYGISYPSDQNLRFVGDGLAELTSYEFCNSKGLDVGLHLKGYCQRIQTMIDKGETEYDLLSQFPAARGLSEHTNTQITGYAISYLFWKRVKDQAGMETIKAFIQKAKKNSVVSQDVQKVLKEISGKDFSTTINLKDALRELKE